MLISTCKKLLAFEDGCFELVGISTGCLSGMAGLKDLSLLVVVGFVWAGRVRESYYGHVMVWE